MCLVQEERQSAITTLPWLTIEVHDEGKEYLERRNTNAKPHLTTEIKPLDADNVMYRGMSYEAYQDILKTGVVRSKGLYNLGDEQVGLTYWSTEIDTAEVYASSFAPASFKAMFTHHPAYVVAAHVPDASNIRTVAGTGKHEVGVIEPISQDALLAVWQGQPYEITSGDIDVHNDWQGQRLGSGSAISSRLIWTRIG